MYFAIMLITCLGATFPIDASAVSLIHTPACCSLSFLPDPGGASLPWSSCPATDQTGCEDSSLSEDPAGETNQFLFLDVHTEIEPYYPSDNAKPRLLLLIGSSMIVLALFGRRMIH